ncbi:MAG: TIGR03960 family B12-binding radical SAM protein [Clostridia bacterium]|nr:TIGR03960 family B12-binding radical SAM protein [Clostridia bacterium]
MYKLDSILKRVEKPARYIGNEINAVHKDNHVGCNFAFAFPDTYEIGMSYTGLQILYNILNKEDDIWCQRVFAPARDMEEIMRNENIPLFALESKMNVKDMDIIGFTLQYEMSYTNILNMLDLAGIPLLREERDDSFPLVIAGGPCAFNPEPLADFIDVFLIGDGEELLPELCELYVEYKGKGKDAFLGAVSRLQGVYVPKLYEISYDENGFITSEFKPVLRAIVDDLDKVDFPTKPLVPLSDVVHDRAIVESFRGCTRGCRFCQAGMIYRPIRERSKDNIINIAKSEIENTGHDELSLLSLSTSDYSDFKGLALGLLDYCSANNVALSLPSLRLDSFSFEVLNEIQKYKKSGLTFAVEAGSQRLRDVINKGITEDDIYEAVSKAIDLGWRNVKLYFMIGLPGETYEDLDGIANIAKHILDIKREKNGGKLGKFNVTVSVSNFVPKAFTPFQWLGQNTAKEFEEKHNYLASQLYVKGITFNYHDNKTSELEALLARGDRRVGKILLNAYKLGAKMDSWSEHFDPELWHKAAQLAGLSIDFYTSRERDVNEALPWDIIDCGVSKAYLLSEYEKSKKALTTHDCRLSCTGCGMNRYTECKWGGCNE